MLPAWERHDFAAYAAQLPGVRRRRRLAWVFAALTALSVFVPAALGLLDLGGPARVAVSLIPFVPIGLMMMAMLCVMTAGMVQRDAIARWMGAADGSVHDDTQLVANLARTRRRELWVGLPFGGILAAIGVWQWTIAPSNPVAWMLAIGGIVLVAAVLAWDATQARAAARLRPRTAGETRQ